MIKVRQYKNNRIRRALRVRKKVRGTAGRPRLAVFRSNFHIYSQLIDDRQGQTLVSASDFDLKKRSDRMENARAVGKTLADRARGAGVTKIVFDRRGYRYHGRVKALAEGAREGGLEF